MTDLPQLDPNDLACLLVGRLMQSWSFLEDELNASVRRLFGLNFSDGLPLTANLAVRDKLSIVRTTVEMQSRDCMTDEWRLEAAKTIGQIEGLSSTRNTVAHSYFEAPDELLPGAAFHRARARKKAETVEIVMTPAEFETFGEACSDAAYALLVLTRELVRPDSPPRAREPIGWLDPLTPRYRPTPRSRE